MKKDNKLKVTYRVNGQIRVPEVRIVGDNIESQVLSIGRARQMAEEMGVDLVEISPNAEGFLSPDGDGSIVFQVVKVYTMADGQPAVKVMRIK